MMLGDDVMTLGESRTTRVGDDVQVIEFWPHLRAPASEHEPLILGTPVCKVRLSGDIGALGHMGARQKSLSLSLIEAW